MVRIHFVLFKYVHEAQLAEHRPSKSVVVGSSPISDANFYALVCRHASNVEKANGITCRFKSCPGCQFLWGRSVMVRTPACHAGSLCRFEPGRSRQFKVFSFVRKAQLDEHPTTNRKVASSILAADANFSDCSLKSKNNEV